MKNRKGFSINEVMISMFVMSVGIVTVIGLFSKGFINSQLDRDRIVAAGLAQEGVELVKNVRDNSFARGSSDNFEYFSISNKYCRANYDTSALASVDCSNSAGDRPSDNPTRYKLTLSGGYYKHINAATDKFSRFIYIDYNNGQKYAEVTSFVYWNAVPESIQAGTLTNCHIGNKCVYSRMRLEDWKP